jgi:hypothetical protein
MARVYLFGSGRFLGFSLRESGEGLPPGTGKRRIPLTSPELTPEFCALPVDSLRVLNGIISRGYYLAPRWPTSVLPAARRHPT